MLDQLLAQVLLDRAAAAPASWATAGTASGAGRGADGALSPAGPGGLPPGGLALWVDLGRARGGLAERALAFRGADRGRRALRRRPRRLRQPAPHPGTRCRPRVLREAVQRMASAVAAGPAPAAGAPRWIA
ncbi:hypothetical protein LT493_20680 [Streptomyces tricolor]|nr:hypothetical protein [Streptomyces tricolor]